ncbi:MAG: hypothetical protein GY830_10420 [Bacteroidetes bacterium]|nr:hypothetical protein [Bacteroidota bacterium]
MKNKYFNYNLFIYLFLIFFSCRTNNTKKMQENIKKIFVNELNEKLKDPQLQGICFFSQKYKLLFGNYIQIEKDLVNAIKSSNHCSYIDIDLHLQKIKKYQIKLDCPLITTNGDNILITATRFSSIDILEYLLSKVDSYDNINSENKDHKNALEYAIIGYNINSNKTKSIEFKNEIKTLIKYGADINLLCNKNSSCIKFLKNDLIDIYFENNIKNCSNCYKKNYTKRCSRCKQAYYCSINCQSMDWKEHKINCIKNKS